MIDLGILYYGSTTNLLLRDYCVADYAGDHDDQKSRIGYIFLLTNDVVAWCSKRQGYTADSTTEAEFVALAESVNETIWLSSSLQFGFFSAPTHHHFLRQSRTIQLVKNPKYHKRTKHIESKYYLIREKYERKEIDVHYVHTKRQFADILTKALFRKV